MWESVFFIQILASSHGNGIHYAAEKTVGKKQWCKIRFLCFDTLLLPAVGVKKFL